MGIPWAVVHKVVDAVAWPFSQDAGTMALVDWSSNDASLGSLAEWVSAFLGMVALVAAVLSGRSAWRQWKTQYVVAEWYKTVDFLFANPQYLDPIRNQNYGETYSAEEAIKYELVARRSIAYVDDLYQFKLRQHLGSWLKGAVHIFVKPHLSWLRDNHASYSTEFFDAVITELEN
jgi:hypothetical protein